MTSSARSTFAPALKAGTQTFPPLRALIANMPPPPNAKLVAEGAYDLNDREIAAQVTPRLSRSRADEKGNR